MRITIYILTFFTFLSFSSCQDSVSDCFKRNGDLTEIKYEVAPFHQVHAFDGLNVFITQGNEYLVTVRAGEHIISDIKVKNENGILTLADKISCDWARKYEPKEVFVQCPKLNVIYQNGYGNIYSTETLTYDTLHIRARYGPGNVTLDLDSKHIVVVSHRNGTVTLAGETDFLHVGLLHQTPIFDGKALKAQHVEVVHNCNNSIHLYPLHTLQGKLLKKGNVYLYHLPDHVDVKITGKGGIIDMSANS